MTRGASAGGDELVQQLPDAPVDLVGDRPYLWLVFSGGIDGRAGTWLLEATSHRLVRLSDISLNDLAWSPDGRQIVGVFNPDPGTWPRRTRYSSSG